MERNLFYRRARTEMMTKREIFEDGKRFRTTNSLRVHDKRGSIHSPSRNSLYKTVFFFFLSFFTAFIHWYTVVDFTVRDG